MCPVSCKVLSTTVFDKSCALYCIVSTIQVDQHFRKSFPSPSKTTDEILVQVVTINVVRKGVHSRLTVFVSKDLLIQAFVSLGLLLSTFFSRYRKLDFIVKREILPEYSI